MSVDTTVVVAAMKKESYYGGFEWQFTATTVQAVENLTDSRTDKEYALECANAYFDCSNRVWWTSLDRAIKFAQLIQEEENSLGTLEYWDIPIVKITKDGVSPWVQKRRRNRNRHKNR